MIRTAVTAFSLVSLVLAGCSWFDSKKQPLSGERISVLSLDRQLEPDPDLAKIPISLPAPVVNPDWPEPGGYPNHAMQHLSLPDSLTQVWKASTGEGASRYSRVLSHPIVEKGRVYAMDGAVQVSAYDAATGDPMAGRSQTRGRARHLIRRRRRFLERPAICVDRLCPGFGPRSGGREGDLEEQCWRPSA